LELWVLADEAARGAGVVEVDVREEEVLDVPELVTAPREPGLERVEAARGAAVEERRPRLGLEQVGADRPGAPAVQQVDRLVGQG
jgi:hypothetical protein